MLLAPSSLIPTRLLAGHVPSANKDDLAAWNEKRFPKSGAVDEAPAPAEKPKRCFNWTDTRGDEFAVCFAADQFEAMGYIWQHAFIHMTEIDKAERESMGRSLPKHRKALDLYYARLKDRAGKMTAGIKLRELTRDGFDELCRRQREGASG